MFLKSESEAEVAFQDAGYLRDDDDTPSTLLRKGMIAVTRVGETNARRSLSYDP